MSTFAERYRSLQPRVKTVVDLATMSMTSRAIALELGVSLSTVRLDLQRAFEVLGVESRLQLANLVAEMRLQERA